MSLSTLGCKLENKNRHNLLNIEKDLCDLEIFTAFPLVLNDNIRLSVGIDAHINRQRLYHRVTIVHTAPGDGIDAASCHQASAAALAGGKSLRFSATLFSVFFIIVYPQFAGDSKPP